MNVAQYSQQKVVGVRKVTKVVIQHVAGKREKTIADLLSAFPHAHVVECDGNPMRTFFRAMEALDSGGLFFEDDAILSSRFHEKASAYYGSECPVTFFRLDARPDGTHRRAASTWSMNVGWWVPPGLGSAIEPFWQTWRYKDKHPTGFDLLVRDLLIARKQHYLAVYPSLVQHAVGKSLLGPRSSKRQSPTFKS